MKLLTKANCKALPALYTQESKGDDAIAHVKFFTPDAQATWYATEFDGDDTFFGYCDLGYGSPELGCFSLSELLKVRGKLGLPIERDRYFKPTTLAEVKKLH